MMGFEKVENETYFQLFSNPLHPSCLQFLQRICCSLNVDDDVLYLAKKSTK